MSVERRRSSRIPFAASAEIIDEAENTRNTSQVSDLSLYGCFVQLPNPFPEGTPVTIEIYKDEDFVETAATVAYFMPKRGMDLAIKTHRAPRVNLLAPVCRRFVEPVTTVSKVRTTRSHGQALRCTQLILCRKRPRSTCSPRLLKWRRNFFR